MLLPGTAGEAQDARIGQQEGEQQEEQQAEKEVFAWQSEDPWVESESMRRKVPQLGVCQESCVNGMAS